MPVLRAVLGLDLRGIARDHVAVATIALSLLGTVAISALGLVQARLPGWSEWFPFMVAVGLVGAPGGIGFLFGILMVEEGETGVRQALAVTPVPPNRLLLLRTVIATTWTAIWSLASVYLMNATWRAVELSFADWLAVVGPLALLTPGFALLIPALAKDKVGALAVFKGLSFVSLAPLMLFFVRDGTYGHVLLASPTAWVVESFQSLLVPGASAGRWIAGAFLYAMGLLWIVSHLYRRRLYVSH